MIRIVHILLALIFTLSSLAQTGQAEKDKTAPYLDSLLTAELISRRMVNDTTFQISYDSPVLGNHMSTIHLIKKIRKKEAAYHLELMTQGSTVFVGWKGAILVFTDGTKMKKPNAKIDIAISDNGYRYSTSIALTQADMKILSSKSIDKFRLNIFEGAVNSKDAGMLKIYAKNIVKLK